MEIWKDIKGTNGKYSISDRGRLRSNDYRHTKTKKIMKLSNCQGYLTTTIYYNKKPKAIKTSRLVAMAFIDNPKNKLQVNHIDGNKSNDNVLNLEWVTPKENTQHAIKTGLQKVKGSTNYNSKLTENDVINIKKEYIPGKTRMVDIAKKYNVNRVVIGHIFNNKQWRHVK